MRRAYHDNEFLYSDDSDEGDVQAACLGYDFTAEHEWGVRRLKEAFGVGEAASQGVESRRATILPKDLSFYLSRGGNEALLSYCSSFDGEVCKASTLRFGDLLKFRDFRDPKDDFVSAWDEKSFGIHVRGEKNVNALKCLYKGFKRCAIVFGMSPAKHWIGSGLTFALEDSFTAEMKAEILAADKSHARLLSTVKNSGIEDVLKKAGCRYFALHPEWKEDDESEIRFFLNPTEQAVNNFGWFSLADLEAWTKGTGPIPKQG